MVGVVTDHLIAHSPVGDNTNRGPGEAIESLLDHNKSTGYGDICDMRVVGEIPHPECKITIFHWNNKYLIKLELGPFEQTFKISELELTSEAQLQEIVNEDFIARAMARFADMSKSLEDATSEI